MAAPAPRNLRVRVKAVQETKAKEAELQRVASALDALARRKMVDDELTDLQESMNNAMMRVVEAAKKTRRVPVSLGDLSGPQGNVFWIVNNCRAALDWASKNGLADCITPGAVQVVQQYRDRTYDETLDMLNLYYLDIDLSIPRLRAKTGLNLPENQNPLI